MLKMFRDREAAKVTLGTMFLLGCTAHQPPAMAQAANGAKPPLSVNTPLEVIAADPRGKAILNQDLPGLTTNPHYALFSDMSLSQLAPMSGGRLNQANLAKVENDLTQLSYKETSDQ